jgi:hypothetical protein
VSKTSNRDIIRFMVLYRKLREMIDDDPTGLEALAAGDGSVEELCLEVEDAADRLSLEERKHPELFSAPVDPNFIFAWRDYEARYKSILESVEAAHLFRGVGLELPSEGFASHWEYVSGQAGSRARGIEAALDFANEQAHQDVGFPGGHRDFGDEDFAQGIVDGVSEWNRLREETGFDLEGVFRRRDLVPFVLIPRHVSSKHGEEEALSLLTNLRQAHEAFVFGVPFAALALMRSILEVVLTMHYDASGKDLEEKIDNTRSLPASVWKSNLHSLRRLSNDVLHVNKDRARLPQDMERQLLIFLDMLRKLIEGAPVFRA